MQASLIINLMPKTSHYQKLRDKWVSRHRELSENLWTKHKKSLEWLKDYSQKIALGSAATALLLTSPIKPNLIFPQISTVQTANAIDKQNFLVLDLTNFLPKEVRELTPYEEEKLTNKLSEDFGIPVKTGIDGIRLNRSYGLIGQEQHLTRYPGDNINNHNLQSYGMAPGFGAWRYFADSQDQMTEKDSLREKYYIAVPTFLAPGFNNHVSEYIDFFKYRKMIVVNPQNGKAIVADIADSGPAVWTGKHLGGSPEVMNYLERVDRTPVVYFFIDDPNDKIPLGPINPVK